VHVRGQAISRLADGREVAVQLLSTEENVAESDIILSVRRWHVCDRKLDSAVDLIISKHCTFSQLRDTIATLADLEGFMPELEPAAEPVAEPAPGTDMEAECEPQPESEVEPESQAELEVPQLRRLGLAKASAFGPPLDHRVCRQTLVRPLLRHANCQIRPGLSLSCAGRNQAQMEPELPG
jgi:hypothetical protein